MLLYNSAICDLLRESIQMMKWILLGNFLCQLRETTPPKKNYFVNFPAWEKCHRLLENSRNATKKFAVACRSWQPIFLFFFTKVCFFLKKIVKNTKKSEKIKWHQKLAVHHIILQGIYFGGVWSFVDISKKYILPKLLFWELSAGQGQGERMGLPWNI